MVATSDERALLGIYLNDHLAGATAGTNLAWRLAEAERDNPGGAELHRVATEITEDRAALLELMSALKVPVRQYKVLGAWLAERAGRLKFNGRLVGRSPLSGLLELELLTLGVQGKAAGWKALRALADSWNSLDPARLDELLERARGQSETLERLRVRAAEHAFGASG